MKKINWYFERKDLAQRYLEHIGLGPISRIAILGVRRIGKTAFLLNDVAPRSIELGFYPVYINMWADLSSPQDEIIYTLQNYIAAFESGHVDNLNSVSQLLKSEVRKLDINLGLIKASIDTSTPIKSVTKSQITEINKLIKTLVLLSRKKDKRLLFILDEVQHLNTNEDFLPIQYALRTQFDNFDDTCVIYAGSSRGGVSAMFNSDMIKFGTKQIAMPFYNSATLMDFPRLDEDFVKFYHTILTDTFSLDYDINALENSFKSLDFSPYWFRTLMGELTFKREPLSNAMEIIKAKIQVDGGLQDLVKKLNKLDKLVFNRIYELKTLFSEDALNAYAKYTDKAVNKGSIQNSVSKLERLGIVTKADNKFFIEKIGLYELANDA